MDFDLPGEDHPYRRSLREWLGTHPEPSGRELAKAGYVAPRWPAPWGLDADPIQQLVIDAELKRAGVSRAGDPAAIGVVQPNLTGERVLGLPHDVDVEQRLSWAEASRGGE